MEISNFKGTYDWLSNFYPIGIQLGDVVYPSVEHAYQAAKTTKADEREEIRLASTAKQAKKLGKLVTMRGDWVEKKVEIMEGLVREKFMNEALKRKLLETGHAKLIEGNWWGDTFWGVCKGKGENHLGKILMKIREEIRDGQ